MFPATILTALFFVWIVTEGIRAQFTDSKTGISSMIGKQAEVVDKIDNSHGKVFVNGEYWDAISDGSTIEEGEFCEITEIEGLKMKVRPLSETSDTNNV
ncbi:NfeD family protein [Fodinibius sp.]|uniref:NfeD family protein n=1 Tax=Fodinibius sp. TaxID=1872440 RepID=UPI002ACE4D1D|nr:NfeD family protein [Fodinibius sp.]MDZ7659060.1 NfeD family protein [Fodinibius sp.]